jgi:hypothetical protein
LGSVAVPWIDGAQARKGIEALEKGFGESGEVRVPADSIQVPGEPAARTKGVAALVGSGTCGLEVSEVSCELLAVEVR